MESDQYYRAGVTTIRSIGPARAKMLSTIGVRLVTDLIRLSPHKMHRALSATHRVSLPQIHTWQQMAFLLEVIDMRADWAEVIHLNSIRTIEELSDCRQTHLEEIFAEAEEKRQISTAPTIDQCAALILDATVLLLTSRVGGRVLSSNGIPVEGAQIGLGDNSTSSNKEGYFRLARIIPSNCSPMHISHPEHGTLTLQKPDLIYGSQAITYPAYRLDPCMGHVTTVPCSCAPIRQVEYPTRT